MGEGDPQTASMLRHVCVEPAKASCIVPDGSHAVVQVTYNTADGTGASCGLKSRSAAAKGRAVAENRKAQLHKRHNLNSDVVMIMHASFS